MSPIVIHSAAAAIDEKEIIIVYNVRRYIDFLLFNGRAHFIYKFIPYVFINVSTHSHTEILIVLCSRTHNNNIVLLAKQKSLVHSIFRIHITPVLKSIIVNLVFRKRQFQLLFVGRIVAIGSV